MVRLLQPCDNFLKRHLVSGMVAITKGGNEGHASLSVTRERRAGLTVFAKARRRRYTGVRCIGLVTFSDAEGVPLFI